MRKPVPTQNESLFHISELFFSTTDAKGLIQFGNDVFVRVSGYGKDTLIGAPHNIIRHPDMPRVVFKLLWDTIQSGNMIVAYVKNMSADGSYYWVLAAVFPIRDIYFSIRLKPTSPLLPIVESLYQETLKVEKNQSVDASKDFILKKISELGFSSYEQFMISALYKEISLRDEVLIQQTYSDTNQRQNTPSQKNIHEICVMTKQSGQQYRKMFKDIQDFMTASKLFSENSHKLFETFTEHSMLSLNMQILAEQIGSIAAPLSVVAGNFEDITKNIRNTLTQFVSLGDELSKKLQDVTQSLCVMKLVMDMLEFFIKESMTKIESQTASAEVCFQEIQDNVQNFSFITQKYSVLVKSQQREMSILLDDFAISNTEIRKFINNIELISKVGAIESARDLSVDNQFGVHIQSMRDFSLTVGESSLAINTATKELSKKSKDLEKGIALVFDKVTQILDLVLKIKS